MTWRMRKSTHIYVTYQYHIINESDKSPKLTED